MRILTTESLPSAMKPFHSSFTARTVVVELDNSAAVSLDAPNRPSYHREGPVGGGLRGCDEDAPAGLLHSGARVARRGGGGPSPAGASFKSQVMALIDG